jgi:hypothetical protein
LVAGKLLRHDNGVDAPEQDYTALQATCNKDLRTYVIQYVAHVMHKAGNIYADLPPMCVLIKIDMKYPCTEGVYRTFLPTLEQIFIDAKMALREYNRKTYFYGPDLEFPYNCIIGSLERAYVEKKYGALYASGYNDHLVDLGMYESAAYLIFLKYQSW